MNKHRIGLLDSFRCMAILSVLLYHYTSRWTGLYPYGHFFGDVFKYGYFGVNFFFMISGFVINYTLENTSGPAAFFRNRFSRLFPAMLLCSVLTFLVMRTLDTQQLFPNAHAPRDFLPGLSFVNPFIWSLVTHLDFHWMNGSYWSLWVEVQFYVIAAAVYFLNRKDFFGNILLAGIVLSIGSYSSVHFSSLHHLRYLMELFNSSFYVLWFLAGVIFYQLYKGFPFKEDELTSAYILAVLYSLFFDSQSFLMGTVCLIMFTLFLLLIYHKEDLAFLDNALFRRVGVISYSIYLVHEDVGVLLINKYGGLLGPLSMLAPFIMIVLVTVFAELSYRFYETKAAALLKKIPG